MNKSTNIPYDILSKFCEMLIQKTGLYFPKEEWPNYEIKLKQIAEAFAFKDVKACMQWLINTPLSDEQITTLAKCLTIGETYFFRDDNLFGALEKIIIPQIIQNRRQEKYLRIWCAACCSGEEPYSIAILLHQLLPDLSDWKINIIGSDINVDFLQRAEKGVYKEWSFRATPEAIKKKYFIKENDGNYQIIPQIKSMVKFFYLNLVEDKYPSLMNETNAMDVILCNNVLIYFNQETILQVANQLTACLVDSGWLIVSAIEVPFVNHEKLSPCIINGSTLFHKTSIPAARAHLSHIDMQPLKPKPKKTPAAEPPLPISADFFSKKEIVKPHDNEEETVSFYFDLYDKREYGELIKRLEKKLQHNLLKKSFTQDQYKLALLLTRSYANMGQLSKARECSNLTLQAEKLLPEPYLLHATILEEMGLQEESIHFLKKALYLDPNCVLAYYVLGNLFLKLGNQQEAKRNFRNAQDVLNKLEPEHVLEGGDGMKVSELKEIINSTEASIVK